MLKDVARGLGPVMALPLLLACLAVDAALVGVHVWAGLTYETIPLPLNIATDGSLAELWGYAKWALAVLALVGAWRRGGGPYMLAAAAAFAIVLLDDAAQIHERGGAVLALRLDLPFLLTIKPDDVGEILVFGAMAAVALAAFAFAWLRSGPGDLHRARWLLVLLVLLALIGVVLDAVHSAVTLGYPIPQILDLVEDGGELMLGSVVAAHAWALWRIPLSSI